MQEKNEIDLLIRLTKTNKITTLKTFSKMLKNHTTSICNYAAYPITSTTIKTNNVGIGLIRKRARNMLNTEYLKLKIQQLNLPDTTEPFYPIRQMKRACISNENIAKNEKITI